MKALVWLVGLFGVFYGHGAWTLSQGKVLRWIERHETAVFEQADGVCKDFSYDVDVSIRAVHAKGEWQVDGGRDYVCGYIRNANASVRLLKPEVRTQTELLGFQRPAFPWMSAQARVRQTTTVTLVNGVTLTEQGESTYVLRRTLGSMQIAELTVRSAGNFPR